MEAFMYNEITNWLSKTNKPRESLYLLKFIYWLFLLSAPPNDLLLHSSSVRFWDELGYYAGYYVAQRILLSDNFSWKKWFSSSLFPFKSNKYASNFTSDTYHTNILVFTIKVLQFPQTNLKWTTCYVFGPDESGIIVLTCFQVLWSYKDYWGLNETSLMKKRVNLSKLECSTTKTIWKRLS